MSERQRVELSAQHGDLESDAILWHLHKHLNELFLEHLERKYFESIERFSVVLRVSGDVQDFGGEGPERLQDLGDDQEVTIDLVIPKARWEGAPPAVLRRYLGEQLGYCFHRMKERAARVSEPISGTDFRADFEAVIAEFVDP